MNVTVTCSEHGEGTSRWECEGDARTLEDLLRASAFLYTQCLMQLEASDRARNEFIETALLWAWLSQVQAFLGGSVLAHPTLSLVRGEAPRDA